MINYQDFSKLEIKIGKIIAAEKMENADKLLRLRVSFGEFERQIISGIAEFYNPELLVGLYCPFLVNLEPKTLRGEESQGMILAADDNGRPILLHPDQEIPEGSTVR